MFSLSIDIGNTTISFGVFRKNKLALNFKLPTHKKQRSFYKQGILRFFKKTKIKKEDFDRIIVCSVVPKKTQALKALLFEIFQKKILLVNRDLKVPIKNKYNKPNQVGQDRLVGAYAALRIYGPGVIIVDFGTAITFDVVSKKREYLGGLIFPGLDLSLDVLSLGTALLPRIRLKRPNALIGKDTIGSINSGIVFGMAGVCDKLIEKLEKRFKGYKVIATGGNADFIKQYSEKIGIIRPFLVLEGLNLLSSV